jgi:hypothetical protein
VLCGAGQRGHERAVSLEKVVEKSESSSPTLPRPEVTQALGVQGKVATLAALEVHSEIVGDVGHGDALLCHGVALTHRDGVVFE